MITQYDAKQHADLVEVISKLTKDREDITMVMTEKWTGMKNEKWSDSEYLTHRNQAERHGVIANEIGMYDRDLAQMVALAPRKKETESQRLADPMTRWGEVVMGKVSKMETHFSAEEQKIHLVNPNEVGAAAFGRSPEDLGNGFRIPFPDQPLHTAPLMVTRSDASSGEEANPEVRLPRIIQRLKAFGGAMTFGEEFVTPRGNDYVIPNLDDSDQTGEVIAAQNTAISDQDLADIGSQTFKAYTFPSKGISVTWEAETDTIPNLMMVVQDIAGRRIGRSMNAALTTGTGTNQPRGIVTCAKEALTSNSSNTIEADDLTNLIYAVDDGYLEGEIDPLGFSAESGMGMLGFMINRGVEKILVQMKDTQNRPLWLPSIRERLGGMIYGQPYVKNYSMQPLTTNNGHSVVYGNGNYYGIRKCGT